MTISVKTQMLSACRHFLRPVIRLLLRAGVSYKDFAEIAKRTYVEVAGDEFGLQGRQTNVSRVSILTGIGRKEVSRLRELLETEGTEFVGKMNPATRVMAAWHQDTAWLDSSGRPRPLAEEQIRSLIEQHAGDIPVSALLKELQTVGAVATADDGRYVARARSFVPGRFDQNSARMLGAHLHDLAATISHNLVEGEHKARRFQRVVSNEAIEARALGRFRTLVNERGEALLEELDDWLRAHEAEEKNVSGPRYRTGVGIYFFEDKLKQDSSQ